MATAHTILSRLPKETYIAGTTIVAIAMHLVLRYGYTRRCELRWLPWLSQENPVETIEELLAVLSSKVMLNDGVHKNSDASCQKYEPHVEEEVRRNGMTPEQAPAFNEKTYNQQNPGKPQVSGVKRFVRSQMFAP
jgi:hypothetical protein